MNDSSAWLSIVMNTAGTVGATIFYGRFYIQWIVSEIRKQSVVPVVFWYLSVVGSLLMFSYGVYLRSTVGTLSHCFNILVYARNLVHIWREKGTLSRGRYWAAHALIVLVVGGGMLLTAFTFWMKYRVSHAAGEAELQRAFFWTLLGTAGIALFALRFLIQWLATERQGKSVVPVSFWWLSIAASLLQMSAHIGLHEWLFAVGVGAPMFVYVRNLMLIHQGTAPEPEEA